MASRPREGLTLSTFRLHSQLSLAIRQSTKLRAQMDAEHSSLANRLLLRCRYVYYSVRVRQLIQHLHNNLHAN